MHPELASHEIAADACYGNRAPVALRGQRIHESADRRDATLEQLLHSRERFAAADLTFAALAGPMVFPPEHPVRSPDDAIPGPMQELRDRLRDTVAGAFAMRMYRDHRGPRGVS